jgi:hypothetical protein
MVASEPTSMNDMAKMAETPMFSPPYQVCGRLYRLNPMAENASFLS